MGYMAAEVPSDHQQAPADGTDDARVELIGKPGCHLCDTARLIVAEVCGRHGVVWREYSILGNADLADRYADLIPVVRVDGVDHSAWQVDATALEQAIIR
jgi:hypothetical protein